MAEQSRKEAAAALGFGPRNGEEPQVALLWRNSWSNGRATVAQTEVFTQQRDWLERISSAGT